MIIFDKMGHMVSTESADELHAFATQIGLKREWYQIPSHRIGEGYHPEMFRHYDLAPSARKRAKAHGATEVEPKELVTRAWWAEKEHVA